MFGGKDSREQDQSGQYDARQGTLFPHDHPYQPDEGLKLHHYLIGGALIAAMVGVLITGYFYSRSLVIQEPKEEAASAAPAAPPTPPTPAAEPAAPPKKIEATAPPQPAAPAAKTVPPQEAKPAPAKAKAASQVYFLQLAAFKDPRETAQLCKQIEPLGFQCYFGNVDTPDGRYWRLRVGPYEAKDKAENDLATLHGKGFDGRLIPLKKSGVKAPLKLPL